MKKVGSVPKKYLCKLIAKLNDKEYIKIKSEGFMDLTIKRMESGYKTPLGEGTMYAMAHFYEEKGDQIPDPIVLFIMADSRTKDLNFYDLVGVYPYSIDYKNKPSHEPALILENKSIDECYPAIYNDYVLFLDQWFINLRNQGFTSDVAEVFYKD